MTTSNTDFLHRSHVLNYSNDGVESWCAAYNKKCQTKNSNTPFLHRRTLILSTALAALLYAGDAMQQVHAQSVNYTGDVNPPPPGGVQHWNVGGDLAVGDDNPGTLTIDAGGTVSNDWAFIGNTSSGTVTVQGSDGSGNASTWTSSGQLYIGTNPGSDGTLNILNGGVVTNGGGVLIADDINTTGTVTVSGPGSTWDSVRPLSFQIGVRGNGTMQIDNGGVVRTGQGLIGREVGSVGHVTVTGPGSTWTPDNNIYVGFEGTGTLDVLDGATVSTQRTGGGAATIYIGLRNGGQGTVNVSSSTSNTSTLSVSDDLRVGVDASGTMTVEKGGLVILSLIHI